MDGVVTVVIEGAGGCEGALASVGVGLASVDVAVVVVVVDDGCKVVLLVCWVAPAAAAEYRIGVSVTGRCG